MPNPKVVRFDVGGTLYKVSQSLLDSYPSCMLTKICSERWQQDGGTTDEQEAIFIDRNGERFQYVLDYMRDAKVQLPMAIPKAQFISDMEYYGLDYDDSNITLSVADPSDLFYSLGRYRE